MRRISLFDQEARRNSKLDVTFLREREGGFFWGGGVRSKKGEQFVGGSLKKNERNRNGEVRKETQLLLS